MRTLHSAAYENYYSFSNLIPYAVCIGVSDCTRLAAPGETVSQATKGTSDYWRLLPFLCDTEEYYQERSRNSGKCFG